MAKKSPGDVKAGGASVAIGADDTLFNKVMKSSEARLKAFAAYAKDIGTRMGLAGGGFVAAAAAVTHSFMELASVADGHGGFLGLTPEDISIAKQMKVAYRDLMRAIFDLSNAIGSALAPSYITMFDAAIVALRAITKFVRENKEWVVAGLAMATAAVVIGSALFALGTVAAMVATIISALATTLLFLQTPLGIGLVAAAGLGGGLAGLGAAVAALNVDFKALGGVLGDVVKFMMRIKDGIIDALIGGDVQLAIDILWKGFEIAGLTALKHIKKALNDLIGEMSFALRTMLGLKKGMFDVGAGDAQLAAAQAALNDLLAKAAAKRKEAVSHIQGPKVFDHLPVGANEIFSQGASHSIASAYNAQNNSIPAQTLAVLKQIAAQNEQILKKPVVQAKVIGG